MSFDDFIEKVGHKHMASRKRSDDNGNTATRTRPISYHSSAQGDMKRAESPEPLHVGVGVGAPPLGGAPAAKQADSETVADSDAAVDDYGGMRVQGAGCCCGRGERKASLFWTEKLAL